ncbi:hypothetical protein M422DRAFT_782347 [Sphaerobolus stellatus SS14]|uniref:Uncharacterized protein n=1 Tax=Sphaerobolus stellatus (strain SS14) TaxID=990650 RepID=A0A0C9UMX2_SPHS4|nr:hypothetical protein M422DRAFT_782347 [Sphaerobolus stellatus SS14]
MLVSDVWIYIARTYLQLTDFGHLAQSCRRLRIALLPLLLEWQTFAGITENTPSSVRACFLHLGRLKRRINFLSEHPEYAIHIRRVQIRRWTDVWNCLEQLSNHNRDRVKRPFPTVLIEAWTSTYQAIIDFVKTLPNLKSLEFYEHRFYLGHCAYTHHFSEVGFYAFDRTHSPWIMEFSVPPGSMATALSIPPVMDDINPNLWPSLVEYFSHFLETLILPVNSVQCTPILTRDLREKTVDSMKKDLKRLSIHSLFFDNKQLDNTSLELVQNADKLHDLNIVSFGLRGILADSLLAKNITAYAGPIELLANLRSTPNLKVLRLQRYSWTAISPVAEKLDSVSRYQIRTLDLCRCSFTILDAESISKVWPFVSDLIIPRRFGEEETQVIFKKKRFLFSKLFTLIALFVQLESVVIMGNACYRSRVPPISIPLKFRSTKPIPSLHTILFSGIGTYHWESEKGWVCERQAKKKSPKYSTEEVQEVDAMLRRCLAPYSMQIGKRLKETWRSRSIRRLFGRVYTDFYY